MSTVSFDTKQNNKVDASKHSVGNEHSEPVVVSKYFKQREPIVRVLGILLLILFFPVIVLCALVVLVTSPGPALFLQKRLGKDGQEFLVIKLRTMYKDAEKRTGPKYCEKRDPRVTPVGRVFRFLHLDELPQLINVVKGEMCLVGPRPERPEIIALHNLNERVPGFTERMRVLPGVTGLAQINLPADQTIDCVIPKVKLDLEYIETASWMLDLRILVCTGLRMLGVRHGRAVKLLGLCRKVSLGQELPKKRVFDGLRRNRIFNLGKTQKGIAAVLGSMADEGEEVDSNGCLEVIAVSESSTSEQQGNSRPRNPR